MKFKIYNSVVLGSVGILLLIILWFAVALEPLDGDLTRIGNFKESDYGYNTAQETFESNLAEFAEGGKDYNFYRDVIVVGDSFSDQRRRRFGWQNFFIKGTGLSLVTFFHNAQANTLEDLTTSEGFVRHPPRILIYESVERGLYSLMLRSRHRGQCKEQPELAIDPIPINELSIRTTHSNRNNRTRFDAPLWDHAANNFEYSLLYVSLALKIIFTPGSGTSVDELPIRNRQLFSNKRSNYILVLKDDYKKSGLGKSELESIECGMFNLQSIVEKNGKTKLLIMLVPDKTSAYSDFILDNKNIPGSIIPRIPNTAKMPLPRIDLAIREAIADGETDVYLPNDTHLGSGGNRIAADCLINYMIDKGMLGR
jgi:hypothetical protein